MLFENNDFGMISFVDFPGTDFDKQLYSVDEGFTKGNMFVNEYKPYKNYKVKQIKATNKKDEKLYTIMALGFAITDLNLYLDLHPDDTENVKKFKSYVKQKETLEEEFVKEYGPLKLEQVSGNTFNWVSDFPWERMGGSMYV